MVDEERFGDYLARQLAMRGMNRSQAGTRLGVTRSMVSQWVNNHRVPKPENVERLAALLGVDNDELLVRAGHRRRVDTDMHPARSELLEMARQLPLEEAETAIDFMRWRLERSRLGQGLPRAGSQSARPGTDAGDDRGGR